METELTTTSPWRIDGGTSSNLVYYPNEYWSTPTMRATPLSIAEAAYLKKLASKERRLKEILVRLAENEAFEAEFDFDEDS